jgi:peptidoglycan hydrolase-like protein with peptidoglycan-binding domain
VVVVRPTRRTGTEPSSKPVATATVTRQDLVVDDERDATLGYRGDFTVTSAAGGTLTWLPSAGQIVTRGQPVYRVDGRPVPLLHGGTPLWRKLFAGAGAGPDVRELEQNLAALGYFTGRPDAAYTSATATAVRKWQKALGVDQTGTVEASAVVVLPGDIRVTSVDATLGGPAQGKLLRASGVDRVVSVKMPVNRQAEAVEGATVAVTLPDGRHTTGTVSTIGTVATADGDKPPTFDVQITPLDPSALGKLDGAPVTVGFTSQRKAGVLTVPIEALLALAEGGYAVEKTDGTLVKVGLGLFARGRVEVTGSGVTDGMAVKVAST